MDTKPRPTRKEQHNGHLLTTLPAELVDHVLSFLKATDLVQVALVCRLLHQHALKDLLWIPLIKANIPGMTNLSQENILACRHALTVLHPYTFLLRQKLWYSDSRATGTLIICRYDPQTRTILGHTLAAVRESSDFEFWSYEQDVIIHRFNPIVNLDLDTPLIRIDAASLRAREGEGPKLGQPVRMVPHQVQPRVHIQHSLMPAKPWPRTMSPSSQMWPPPILPAKERCRTDSISNFSSSGHRPHTLAEMSDSTFRIHSSVQKTSLSSFPPMNDRVTAWSTLPAEVYTPTKTKPWRGVWVGDYSGHGCEFLVVLQPEEPLPLPEKAIRGLARREKRSDSVSSTESYDTAPSVVGSDGLEDNASEEKRPTKDGNPSTSNPDIYEGRLEAIKLTGDANVPRGEYTFIAPDIGPGGLLRIATEDLFRGARVVNSVGHIASRGYRDDEYITSQLVLVSENRIAQYWEQFGHISFYQRVDIDKFLKM